MTRLWILGAPDPEMTRIEALLREQGEEVAYATVAGKRVHPGNAYKADDVPDVGGKYVILVECDVPALHDITPGCWCVDAPRCGCVDGQNMPAHIARVDHHREGDPGYGRPSSEFLPASSIGQVLNLLAQDEIPVTATGPYFHPLPMLNWRPLDKGDRAYRPCPIKPGLHWLEFLPEDDEGGFPMGHWALVVKTSGPVPLSESRKMLIHGEDREINGQIFKCDCIYHTKKPILWWASLSGGTSPRLQDILHTAAADHCLAAAYRGECPGVEPDALMQWRVESRAKFQGRSVESLMADVESARKELRSRVVPHAVIPGAVADFGDSTVPELPEAAAREGIAFLATVTDRDGRKKVVLQAASSEQVKAFLSHYPVQDKYGDPARGFAGGYIA